MNKVLLEFQNFQNVKCRVVGAIRDDQDIADIYVEKQSSDRDGNIYWEVVSHRAVWSIDARTEFGRRHNTFDEDMKADHQVSGIVFDLLK